VLLCSQREEKLVQTFLYVFGAEYAVCSVESYQILLSFDSLFKELLFLYKTYFLCRFEA
jgi:hypothetical protein